MRDAFEPNAPLHLAFRGFGSDPDCPAFGA